MSLKVFLELVEIKAKTASILPFLIGICFSYYYYNSVHLGLSVVFFVAMLLFNMAVDALDNYNDYHHAVDKLEYKRKTNIIGRENISPKLVFAILAIMTVIAAIMGLYLVYVTGLPLLWMGMFCFTVGIFYSSGPRPLSSLPLGEFFSGITMGFVISLICVYLNSYQIFSWHWENLAKIFLISLPNILWISNLMLANNICDYDEDERNNRHTIVHFIGVKNALFAFSLKNVLAFAAIILSFYLKLAPWTSLLALLAIPFVYKQDRMLMKEQIKSKTFKCAVKILAFGSFIQVLTYSIGLLFL